MSVPPFISHNITYNDGDEIHARKSRASFNAGLVEH